MFKNNLRPYEISLWTLQDGFITVLKAINVFNRGRIETPKSRIKSDGTQEINFTIPMYYYENGEWVENPIWYNVINGALIVNLRKLKLIFNKGEKGKEEIFEFVITKVTETHTDGQLKCEVTAEGLAFQELGKVGYKISLSSEDFINEYNDWAESDKSTVEPKNNLNYWCDKIFTNSKWSYEIQMDWTAYDGVINKSLTNDEREALGLRRTDTIYEEDFISSWEYDDNSLVPLKIETFKEKLRLVDLEKSNIYNLTQNLAETFGIFCKYIYEYDDNYHIIGKKCIFYNNFLSEREGKIDIIYPYSASKIEREIDSSDIVTKMFVTSVESDSSPSGLITIADVAANRSREDYILNFDYLYSIGTITEEQYNAIPDYERSIYLINTEIEPIASRIANLQTELVKYKAQETIAKEAQLLDKEQLEQSTALLDSLTKGEGFLSKNKDVPFRGTLLESADKDGTYYIKISQEGVDVKNQFKYKLDEWTEKDESSKDVTKTVWAKGIRLYYRSAADATSPIVIKQYLDGEAEFDLPDNDETLISPEGGAYPSSIKLNLDDNGNLVSLSNIHLPEDAISKNFSVTFAYRPSLYYENIYNTFSKKLLEDEASEKEAASKISDIEEKIKKLEERYELLLDQKKKIIADFENMMGPALKEGSWQADNYEDYGNKYNQLVTVDISNESHINFYWDDIPFEEEQKLYYETFGDNGDSIKKNYYPCISLKQDLDKIKDYLDTISFIYDNNQKQMTIGAEMAFAFVGEEKEPVLLLLNHEFVSVNDGFLGTISSIIDKGEIKVQINKIVENITWKTLNNSSVIYYPRLKVDSLLLKTSEDELIIKLGDSILRNYYDYYILSRGENYYITIKEKVMLSGGNTNKTFDVSYSLSNAALSLYLDALEVSKTNAFPQVSYTLEVSAMNKDFIEVAYKTLNKIVSINDTDLKFEDVQGYISELELDLDKPWEDSITIQNYKTKFEDLFSTIVASTEQMKTNSFAYNNAASAFGPGGTLKTTVLQSTINQTDLTYAFQNGNLTIDELNGIWARSDSGVVAIRGGGIFCATQKDSNGNWIWNTGILPSGINASLITAGQLDTNLIKIYAGDNLRLQLNGDGLFAYKPNELGDADLTQYIVHNSEGLFSTIEKNDANKTKINLVEVSWNGFILRDEDGGVVFNADRAGNLTITGTVNAGAGSIGGWEIRDTGLWYENGSAGLTTGSGVIYDDLGHALNGEEKMLWVTGSQNQDGTINEFVVTKDGTMYCSDVIVRGTVSAGSFVGNTLVGEIDEQLRTISIAVLDGTTFSYENRNYDGNLIKSPAQLKFRIYTNALTKEELTPIPASSEAKVSQLDGYHFFWGTINTETNEIDWKEISDNENLVWEPNYLTFRIKNDIMLMELEDAIHPHSLIYIKVTKEGKQRVVSKSGEVSYEGITTGEGEEQKTSSYIYEDSIAIDAQTFGLGKFVTLIDPPSYSFIEDKNNEISYADETTFSTILTGFSFAKDSEELFDSYWTIKGTNYEKKISLRSSKTIDNKVDEIGYAALISDGSEIIINGEEVEEPYYEGEELILTTIDGREAEGEQGFNVSLEEQPDGSIIASLTFIHSKLKEGESVIIEYHIGQAVRSAQCFKIKNGADGINVIMRSSSGSSLMTGDISTELNTDIYYGTQLMNDTNSKTEFFYVWKKDGIALSEINISSIKEIENSETTEITFDQEIKTIFAEVNGKGNPDFFKQKSIYITAADFGSKAIYRCDVFSKIKKENKEDPNEAVDEYLLMNEAGHTELIF